MDTQMNTIHVNIAKPNAANTFLSDTLLAYEQKIDYFMVFLRYFAVLNRPIFFRRTRNYEPLELYS